MHRLLVRVPVRVLVLPSMSGRCFQEGKLLSWVKHRRMNHQKVSCQVVGMYACNKNRRHWKHTVLQFFYSKLLPCLPDFQIKGTHVFPCISTSLPPETLNWQKLWGFFVNASVWENFATVKHRLIKPCSFTALERCRRGRMSVQQ